MGSVHPLPRPKYDGHTRAGLDLADEREAIYLRAGGDCETCKLVCPLQVGQVAHKIANTIANRKRYGDRVIDSIYNKAWTHPGRCNSAQNCGGKPNKCAEIVALVEKK
jgi:hypothetical protein